MLTQTLVSLVLGTLLQANLVSNGTFDTEAGSWIPQGDAAKKTTSTFRKGEGRSGGSLYLSSQSDDPQMLAIWRYQLPTFPKGKALKLSLWIKGKNVSSFTGACMQGWSKGYTDIVDFATTGTTKPLKGSFDWTQVETTLNPSSKSEAITLLLMLPGTGEAWFDDITITAEGDSKPEAMASNNMAGNPGLFELKGQSTLTASKDSGPSKILVPVPLDYREQVPLTYTMLTKPSTAAKGYRLFEDKPGNYVIEIEVNPLKAGEKIEFEWNALVLGAPREDKLPSKAAFPISWPDEAKPWLKSSWCVQCDDPKFRDIGRTLRSGGADVVQVVKKAITKAGEIMRSQKGRCTSLDAVQALEKQGSCTSNANLMAALLRSSGVPARILAGYPSWSGPLQTHYNVEAYVPGYGWYLIESTLLQPWQPYGQIQVSILPTEYEDKSTGRFPAAPGVPYLSLTEFSGPPTFGWYSKLDGKEYCDHACYAVKALDGDSAEWTAALDKSRKAWRQWLTDNAGKMLTSPPSTSVDAGAVRQKTLTQLGK